MKLDGAIIAENILENLRAQKLPGRFLAGVLVGKNPASRSFLAQKKKTAEALGVDFRIYEFSETLSGDELRKIVGGISALSKCGGVIVQLPLPGTINAQYVLNAVAPEKDVDVLGERALGAFYAGRGKILPPSVAVVEEILKKLPVDLRTSTVAVVGAGQLVGRPVATWMTGGCKELFVLDKGSDFNELKKADLVILGTGVAGLVKPEMLKDGAGVIDFGYGKSPDGKVSGDLDVPQLLTTNYSLLTFFTPTPGGTGPILVAKILENFYKLNKD